LEIESDPVLAGTKLIAEAWDAAGLYQVGSFVGDAWQEWNGKFRDDVRRFVKSDDGTVLAFGYRCFGSPDLYAQKERGPEQSVNFVTSHDGFTLNDLVTYDGKHNETNGELGRDGTEWNLSWNCGVEGPTDDPEVERLRQRQVKNFLAITLLSIGTPMLLMGDEVRRHAAREQQRLLSRTTRSAGSTGRCVDRHRDLHRFVKTLVHQRLRHGEAFGDERLSLNELLREADVQPHGVRLHEPDLRPQSHSIAVTVRGRGPAALVHVMCNAYWEPLTFELPASGRAPAHGDDGSTLTGMRQTTSRTASDPRWTIRTTRCSRAPS
jgi:glycogen operon protein